MLRITHIITIGTLVLLLVGQMQANPYELIQNGDFEIGDLHNDLPTVVKWTYFVTGSADQGGWYSFQPTALLPAPLPAQFFAPLTGFPIITGPGSYGDKFALYDTPGFTNTTFFQNFEVTQPMTSVVLSFDMFVSDWMGWTLTPDQFGYVGIYPGGTLPPELNPDLALTTLYLDVDSMFGSPLTHYDFDITSFVGDGGDYNLVFGAWADSDPLTMGIDNVSILATPVPVPAAVLLGILGMGVAGLKLRKFA